MRINHQWITRSTFTGVIAFFLFACNKNLVALDYTNAKGEVPVLGNLTFRFSKSIYPDSLINNWDSTAYIRFEPSIPGRFRWNGPDELVFSPSQPLLPSTTYHASFSDEVLHYSKYSEIQNSDALQFHTPALQLDNARVTWVLPDEAGGAAVPQLQLQFNYPVKADDIKDKLHVLVDGKSQDFSLQNIGSTDLISVRLNKFAEKDRDYEAQVQLDKDLKPEKGGNGTMEPIKTSLEIPSPYVLNVNNVESEHDGTEGSVTIYTSQQLTGEPVEKFIHFEPAVSYTVEYTDEGLVLHSDKFDPEKAYSFTISKGLRGKIGGVLKEDYNGNLAFGQLASDIHFTNSKAVYLSKFGGGNLEVRITNTPKVRLVISKIYENNLVMANRYGYEPNDRMENTPDNNANDGEGEGQPEYSSYENDAVTGDIIYTRDIDTRTLPKSGSGRILNISQFEDRLPDLRGIYHIMIRSASDYWIRDNRFISFSDIGLMARQGQDKLYVFANSIKSTTPLKGVTVNVYGANNQLVGTGATGNDGVATLAINNRNFSGFKPAMIIAKTADDFTYLPFSSTKVNTSRFDVGGKRNNTTGLDAFIYEERDIYRPGEKLNYAVLVRDRNWKSPGELPLKIKFLLPNGKELKSVRKTLNEQGAVDGSLDIDLADITGTYSLEVYSANDVLLATRNFMIEEFVPDRIRVQARLDKAFLRPAEAAKLNINAVNFFGPPAANRKYETEIQVHQKQFTSKRYRNYDFMLANQKEFSDKDVREGTTDANGNASINYEVPALYSNKGLLQAGFYTTVFDETGRPVSRHTVTDIFTQEVFYGVRADGYDFYALNQPVNFELVAVNKDDSPVNAEAHVEVVKHEYRTILAKSGSYFRYESQPQEKVAASVNVNINGHATYPFVPRSPGDYEIRIYRPGASAYVSKRFYSYGSWGADNNAFEVNTEGQIDIEADREHYESGDRAKLLFKTPFSGRMLITLETDHVISYQYVDVSMRTASVDIPLDGNEVPNVYVTATLIKPHEVSDLPLTVAHGFKSLTVEEKARKIPVEITAGAAVRSRTHQVVRVKALPGSYVSLAAVDNGILQVSDFKTPDPYTYYYQKRALQVAAYDMYPLLFPEIRARLSSTGGDGDLQLDKRQNPMPAKRFKLMSYWGGIRKTNSSGVAEFEYDIPQFSGQVRLMAVAFKDDRFGVAETTTTVADPLVLSSALPRFMSPGDTVLVPVTITNTTGSTATGQAVIHTSGPIKIVGAPGRAMQIQANSEATASFQLVSEAVTGVGKINVEVQALGERFHDETEISVRPPSTLQKLSGSGSIVAGTSQHIEIPQSDFMPGTYRYDLVVSRSPVAEIASQLLYLVQYPFGCTEQTVSAAFPQLYYGDFADAMGFHKSAKENANTNVQEAIRKVKMRQLYNGAITLWDGETVEDWWTTVYAAHFLIEARKAGFDVDNSLLETMLGYISNRLKNRLTINYYYNGNAVRKIAPKEVPYSLYVLALANRAQVSVMNYYKANPELLALDGKYLLSAAYASSGDKRSFVSLLPASFSGETSVQQTGGSYYSVLRDEAIALNALMDVDPGNAQVPFMARHISQRLKTERYINTQESAFSFLALGKLARATAHSNVTADVNVNGKSIAHLEKDWRGKSEQIRSSALDIVTKGNGRLYYSWVAEGISRSGKYTEEDNYIRARRRFFDRFGNPLTGNTFHQNDLVIVELTLENAYRQPVRNIVLTDLLPAGFEIENPRSKEIPGMDWIRDAADPVAMDVRDDRIHFFVDAGSATQHYYYAVRAVSPGVFTQGPVSADAMYNGEIHSYNGAQTVKVLAY